MQPFPQGGGPNASGTLANLCIADAGQISDYSYYSYYYSSHSFRYLLLRTYHVLRGSMVRIFHSTRRLGHFQNLLLPFFPYSLAPT